MRRHLPLILFLRFLFADYSLILESTNVENPHVHILLGEELRWVQAEIKSPISIYETDIDEAKILHLSIIDDKYQSTEFSLDYSTNTTNTVQLRPRPSTVRRLKNVVVRGKSRVSSDQHVSRTQLKQNIQFNFNDVVKSIQAQPGVSSSGDSFSSDMYIQGGAGDEWIGIFDQVWILNPVRWGGRISMFNPLIIDSISLYPAAYPASMGQALSGVLWTKTIEPNPDEWEGYLAFDAGLEAMFHGPIGERSRVLVHTRRFWPDLIYNATSDDDSEFPWVIDGLFKWLLDIDDQRFFQTLFYYSREGMNFPIYNDPDTANMLSPNESDYSNVLFDYVDENAILSIKYFRELESGKRSYFNTTLSIIPRQADWSLTGSDIESLDISVNSLPFQYTLDYFKALNSHQVNAGLFFYQYHLSTTGTAGNTLFIDGKWTNVVSEVDRRDDRDNYLGLYLLDDYKMGDHYVIQTGLRADFFPNDENPLLQPRLGLQYDKGKSRVFLRSGFYSSSPLNQSEGQNTTDLPPQLSWQHVIGSSYRLPKVFLKAELFTKDYRQLWIPNDAVSETNTGERRVFGGDLYLLSDPLPGKRINGYLAYTYVWAEERVMARSKNDFGNLPEVDSYYSPDYLREHTLSSLLEFKPFARSSKTYLKKTAIALDWRLLSGKPYTPATNVIEHRTPGDLPRYEYLYGEYNSLRTPLIHTLNVRLTFPGRLDGFDSFISFQNVLSRKNALDYSWVLEDGPDRNIVTDASYNTVLLGEEAVKRVEALDSSPGIGIRGGFTYRF